MIHLIETATQSRVVPSSPPPRPRRPILAPPPRPSPLTPLVALVASMSLLTHSPLSLAASIEKDDRPSNEFTLYGNIYKKYTIENREAGSEKIVSRSRGITITACASCTNQNDETPKFQSLPQADKAEFSQSGEDETCRAVQGQNEVRFLCAEACTTICTDTMEDYDVREKTKSGFSLSVPFKTKMVKSCMRQCERSCEKPGKTYSFTVPSKGIL